MAWFWNTRPEAVDQQADNSCVATDASTRRDMPINRNIDGVEALQQFDNDLKQKPVLQHFDEENEKITYYSQFPVIFLVVWPQLICSNSDSPICLGHYVMFSSVR